MAEEKLPVAGKYRFTQPFSITYCAEETGGSGIISLCKREETISFAVDDIINSYGGGWDDNEQTFIVGFIAPNGQNRVIPVSKVVKVADTTPEFMSNTPRIGNSATVINKNLWTPKNVLIILTAIAVFIIIIRHFKN